MAPINRANSVLLCLLATQLAFACGAAPAFAGDTGSGTKLVGEIEEDQNAAAAAAAGTDPKALPEGDLTVEDVSVEGNRLVSDEDILNVIQTRRGDRFDREQVMRD